ncbi:MAG: cob(I)yrinic acid a c-diamide adenosyltransferase [Dermatophilaceae bacterium]
MVNLTRIYTKTGDTGTTALGDFSRTRKTDPRLGGLRRCQRGQCCARSRHRCRWPARGRQAQPSLRIQNELFDVGADLCLPLAESLRLRRRLRVDEAWITDLEQDCDRYLAELEPLRSFILPGGSAGAAYLHVATTIVRRAERSTWAAIEAYGVRAGRRPRVRAGSTRRPRPTSTGSPTCLFVLARVANLPTGDILWQPGGGRKTSPKEAPASGD